MDKHKKKQTATVTKQAGVLDISIPSVKHTVSVVSAISGIIALVIMYYFFTNNFIDTTSDIWTEPFNLILIVFILFSFITTGYELLWLLFGKEQILVDKNQLMVKKQILGLGVNKKYDTKKIKKLAFNTDCSKYHRYYMFVMSNGKIQFVYDNKVVYFAQDVDNAEAKTLIDAINQKISV